MAAFCKRSAFFLLLALACDPTISLAKSDDAIFRSSSLMDRIRTVDPTERPETSLIVVSNVGGGRATLPEDATVKAVVVVPDLSTKPRIITTKHICLTTRHVT
jgi:hypothetical protein